MTRGFPSARRCTTCICAADASGRRAEMQAALWLVPPVRERAVCSASEAVEQHDFVFGIQLGGQALDENGLPDSASSVDDPARRAHYVLDEVGQLGALYNFANLGERLWCWQQVTFLGETERRQH